MTGLGNNLGTAHTALDEAAFWRVRHDRDDMTAAERAAFDRWLAASPANETAWQATSALWGIFDDAGDPHLEAMRAAARKARPTPRVWLRPVAAALALVAVPAAIIGFAEFRTVGVGNVDRITRHIQYETQLGERATATLADGTMVTLDSGTALEVRLERTSRRVQLRRGQALFEVAKDKHRPFVVQAGRSAITALGTVFNVKVASTNLHVVLVEGRVAVNATASARSAAVVLTPGQELLATGGLVRVRAIDAAAALLWRKGLIELDRVTLTDAVSRLNEASARPLRIVDPSVGTMRVSGVYRTGSPEGFVAAIAQILPVAGRNTRDGLLIERRKK